MYICVYITQQLFLVTLSNHKHAYGFYSTACQQISLNVTHGSFKGKYYLFTTRLVNLSKLN